MKSSRLNAILGTALAVTALSIVLVAAPVAGATQLSSQSSITANFNSQNIAAGDTIWFQAVVQWVGNSPTTTTNVHFEKQTLTFSEPDGTVFVRGIFSSVVTYSTTATTATTVWDAGAFTWVTTVPASYKGDVFLSGFAFHVPSGGVPGATKVTWAGTFVSSEKCLDFNWKWAAAVYTSFPATNVHPSLNANIGAKPVDDNKLSVYQNSDHAGTPENDKSYLAQGARGGGGSNFTGSYSGTSGIQVCQP